MAKAKGDKEVRKLQYTGGATYTLSLPKKWIKSHNLNTSDGIEIDWRPSGALRLTPFESVEDIKKIILNLDKIPEGGLLDHLMGETRVDFDLNMAGLYIPKCELLKRLNYQWFMRLNKTQIVTSKTTIGKLFSLSFSN